MYTQYHIFPRGDALRIRSITTIIHPVGVVGQHQGQRDISLQDHYPGPVHHHNRFITHTHIHTHIIIFCTQIFQLLYIIFTLL